MTGDGSTGWVTDQASRLAFSNRTDWSRARNAIAALQKRLSHRNPNVQIYALEVSMVKGVDWLCMLISAAGQYTSAKLWKATARGAGIEKLDISLG